mgnify:FL=1|jgi:hypothetical protein
MLIFDKERIVIDIENQVIFITFAINLCLKK